MARILVADDEPGLREFMTDALELEGHAVTAASDGAEAIALLDRRAYDLVFTDLKMPRADGLAVVRKVRADQPETVVVVLTAHGTVSAAVEAMKLGAFDFLQKPIGSPEELCAVAARALEHRQLLDTRERAQRADAGGVKLSHGDPAMQPVVTAIEKVAPTAATVLLLGESGTGKEVAARAIHDLSDRRDRPFMALNCAALTETLLESELFGHEKGAFTGANERRRGRIELAEGGTFFLDEVGELRPQLQAKLLRVIQERTFERVGGARTIEADVRLVAATNRDLRAMIAAGEFREDLYHRLAVFPIRLPPLRERRGDILPIARVLLSRIAAELHRGPLALSEAAERVLVAGSWPGNVRELANALERAAILCDGGRITPDHLWLEPGQPLAAAGVAGAGVGEAGDARGAAAAAAIVDAAAGDRIPTLAELEREGIARALAAVDGNRRRAAELLDIGERTLYDKIKRYGLS